MLHKEYLECGKKSTECKIKNCGIIWSYIAHHVHYETENKLTKEHGIGNFSED